MGGSLKAAHPDLSFVDLHRVADTETRVERVVGKAWRVPEGGDPIPLVESHTLRVGETVAVEPGGEVLAGGLHLRGGRRGRAHSLVAASSFRPSPSRSDVPRLLMQLTGAERQRYRRGSDPLTESHPVPQTPHERARAAEFALANLCPAAARLLPEAVAREVRAVVLFVSEETAFTAFEQLTVDGLRRVMEDLERPVSPHVVPAGLLDALLDRVYEQN